MNRESFLARKNAAKPLDVELSDGSTVKVRKLTQAEVEHSRRNYGTPDKALAGYRHIVCTCALNDDGTQMFDERDVAELTDMDYDDIEAIATAVLKYSGVAREPKKRLIGLRRDPDRRAAMRTALAFGRPDVDALLAEIDADAYAEWQDYFALEPAGWHATQLAVERLTWAIFQRGRREQVPAIPLRTGAESMRTPEQDRIREEMHDARWAAIAAAGEKKG